MTPNFFKNCWYVFIQNITYVNLASQIMQLTGFLPIWTEIMWWVSCKPLSLLLLLKDLVLSSYLNGFFPSWTDTTCLMNLIFDVTVVFAVKYLLTYHDTAKKYELIHTREKSYVWSEFVCEKKIRQLTTLKTNEKNLLLVAFVIKTFVTQRVPKDSILMKFIIEILCFKSTE